MENKTRVGVMEEIEIPEFPKNVIGLVRGSIIVALTDRTSYLGIKKGERIPIGFDGEYICCGPTLTWSIDGLIEEIRSGIWKIAIDKVDFSDKEKSRCFARDIELLK